MENNIFHGCKRLKINFNAFSSFFVAYFHNSVNRKAIFGREKGMKHR